PVTCSPGLLPARVCTAAGCPSTSQGPFTGTLNVPDCGRVNPFTSTTTSPSGTNNNASTCRAPDFSGTFTSTTANPGTWYCPGPHDSNRRTNCSSAPDKPCAPPS